MKWTPEPYMLAAVKWGMDNAHCGLLLDPGMRKTSISLTLVDILLQKKAIRTVLVIVPIRPMYMTWPYEIKKWDHLNHLSYTILHGDKKMEALDAKTTLYFINPEGLKWFFEKGGMAKIKPDMLIVDESTKFKDYSTSRFKMMKPILNNFSRRMILTGEPIPNGYMDLFGQVYIADQGEALGRFITHYRGQYFNEYGFEYKLRNGAAEEIQARLKPKFMRVETKGNIEMPELVPNDIMIDLPPEARKIYKEMEDQFITEIGDKTIMSTNAGVVGGKCRQIANGALYDEFQIAHHIHDAKTAALVDLVEQLQGNPILVCYEFKHDLERIKKAFPNAPCLTGLSGAKLATACDGFNAGTVPVLIGHTLSAGHGLNLQAACHHVCYYGITWDLDGYHQFYKRVWRSGNPFKQVFLHRIIARKTLDQKVVRSLYHKEKEQSSFLEAMRTPYDN